MSSAVESISEYVAVDSESANIAGAVVYWSLRGNVSIDEFEDAWDAEGLDAKDLPALPNLEACLIRGAKRVCSSTRQLVRPIKRGQWCIITESVVDGDARADLKHRTNVRFSVPRPKDGTPIMQIVPETADIVDMTMAKSLAAEASNYALMLTSRDISSWLLDQLKQLHAVSLRDKGGVYFVPRDRLDAWRRTTRVLQGCSDHRVFEIPAMKTADAVEAILTAVRSDADLAFTKLEEYLSGEVISTRGLNAATRELEAMQAYVQHYVELLGQSLPDFEERAETLTGGITAARLVVNSKNGAAQA